jgi:SAM-dependent methyltransferase
LSTGSGEARLINDEKQPAPRTPPESGSLEDNLRLMERAREAYWLRYPGTSPFKLLWRALTVRHSFHLLPGETILELGAGSGLWTKHLSVVTRAESPITAAVFNRELMRTPEQPNVRFVYVEDHAHDLPQESFDYVVGTAILSHNECARNLRAIYRLLKPGGQILFFEANYWNPQVALKNAAPWIGKRMGNAPCQIGLRKYQLMKTASQQGFTDIDVIPYDIVHPRTPPFLVHRLQSLAFIAEHMPLMKEFCGTLYIWARKPGGNTKRRFVNLADHTDLFGSVSFVVPCHNEEMNIPLLVESILGFYGPYVHEIVLVNDNSRDRTAEVAAEVSARDSRVRVVNRQPPNGVGRALRDGYEAATGRYILTMDCDFVHILPEFRDLFDSVAEGYEGAIGSRFTHQSVMINYPFFKILCNRCFHVLVNLLLHLRVRDISNNLKLYRADILKSISIEQEHFAANAETGLKPLLAGYDIREVPISWINRTVEMGRSSFRIVNVAPNYFAALMRMVAKSVQHRKTLTRRLGKDAQ